MGGGRPLSKKIELFISDEDIIAKEEMREVVVVGVGREERYRTLQKQPLLIYSYSHDPHMTFT